MGVRLKPRRCVAAADRERLAARVVKTTTQAGSPSTPAPSRATIKLVSSSSLAGGGKLAPAKDEKFVDEDEQSRLLKAGRVAKKIDFQGLLISIERPKGTVREWKNRATGESGQTKMTADYGYILGTKGMDGEHVDVYVGAKKDATHAYVIHQRKKNPDGTFGEYDEDKAMLGFSSEVDARKTYLEHMGNEEGFVQDVASMPMDEFKAKVLATKNDPQVIKGVAGADFVDVEKTLFGYPAGKKRIAKKIVPLIPEHRVYVEPFAGSAAVLFAKEPSKVEVLADANGDIMRALKAARDLDDAGFKKLARKKWVGDRDYWKRVRDQPHPADDVDYLYKFLYVQHFSFSKWTGKSFATGFEGKVANVVDRIKKNAPRLKGVKILTGDYADVIAKYDADDAFVFLDPPYVGTNSLNGMRGFESLGEEGFDEKRLLDVVTKIKGKFALTYGVKGDLPDMLRAAEKEGKLKLHYWRQYRSAANNPNAAKTGRWLVQMLAVNYDLTDEQKEQMGLVDELPPDWLEPSSEKEAAKKSVFREGAEVALTKAIEEVAAADDVAHALHTIAKALEGALSDEFEVTASEVTPTEDGGVSVHLGVDVAKGIGDGAVETLARHLSGEAEARAWVGVDKKISRSSEDGALTIAEGDRGEGVVQTHERASSVVRDGEPAGWQAVALTSSEIETLKAEAPGAWEEAFKAASSGDTAPLVDLLSSVYTENLSRICQGLVEKATPADVHTDIRLRPDGAEFWEGGELFTPSSQFEDNRLLAMARGDVGPATKAVANLKVPVDAGGLARGHVGWMDIARSGPYLLEGSAGVPERIVERARFKWRAGVQEPTFKEFFFESSTEPALDGRWVMQSVPAGRGRVWLWSRPPEQKMKSRAFEERTVEKKLWCPILKRDNEQRIVTGVVLQPGVVDAQGDIISEEVILSAAHKFVARFNKGTKLGFMHNDFGRRFELLESYIAPTDFELNGRPVKKGSWVMSVKVLDDDVWRDVKDGRLKGFSIGGMARVRQA